ncbi:aspartate-semialdehyde dehydrogenase [bacterium]|nr:aspartate-semialdehyde dehydrogenase [bacterium]
MIDYVIAVVGATGLVGRTMLQVLEEHSFPVRELRPLASERSAGSVIQFRGRDIPVHPVSADAFDGVDIALFSAGGAASREWAPVAVERGAVVIDNSSAWRMHADVPLIVPEVNPSALPDTRARIIANPNCSTIQMVVALKPLHDAYTLQRVIVSTYQAVSGAGSKGLRQLEQERLGNSSVENTFPHAIDGNALPQIAAFADDGFTLEEHKMIDETRKILALPQLAVSPTCVRVPVADSHSEAVSAEFARDFSIDEVRSLLGAFPGVIVQDDPDAAEYPLAAAARGRDEVFVGRLRRDPGVDRGLMMWVVSDNLRKGAATNAVQIAELWRKMKEETR